MDFDRFTSFFTCFLLSVLVLAVLYYIISFSYNLLGFWWSILLLASCARSYYITMVGFNR